MIVLFHENMSLLSTYKFIIIPIEYRTFGPFVYNLAEKQMLISLVIEQRKHEFYRIVKVRFSTSIFMPCEGGITFRTPAKIYFSQG